MRTALTALPPSLRRPLLIILSLTGGGLVATGFLLPWFTQVFTDHYLIAGRQDWLGALLAGMAVTALLRAALTWSQRRVLLRTQRAAAQAANAAALEGLLAADQKALVAQLGTALPGHLLRRQHRAYTLLYGELAQGLAELPTIPVLLAVMLWFDPVLGSLAAVLIGLNAVAYASVARRRARLGDALAKADGQVAARVAYDLALLPAIKASAAESVIEQGWLRAYEDQAAAVRKLALAGQALALVPHVVAGLAVAALLTLGALRIISGAASVGDLVACQTLLFSINDALSRFIEASRLYPQVAADLQRRQLLLEVAREAGTDSVEDNPLPQPAAAEFRAVGIGYAGLPVELVLPPGGQLAIRADEQGGTHALCRALAGLDHETVDRVRLGEVPLGALSPECRAVTVALVDGGSVPFDDSLRENVRLWDPRLDDRAVEQALYLAGFEEALRLPGGLGLSLGRRGLSGGQLRRVALAQALIRRPRVVILDGALEPLDGALVRRILERLEQAGLITVVSSPRDDVLALCRYRLVPIDGVWTAVPQPAFPV